MKRFLVALLVCAVLALPQPAKADVTLLSAVTATGASTAYPIANATAIRVQVWSAAGSVSTVKIEQRANASTAPWFPVATITDPSVTGEYWSCPTSAFIRVNVTAYTSGSISATLEAYRGEVRLF